MKEADIFIEYKGRKYGAYHKCPQWLKDSFRRAVNYTCQRCKKNESEVGTLEIHRPKRGIDGGLYVCVPLNHPLCNSKVLCSKCHDLFDYPRKNGGYY